MNTGNCYVTGDKEENYIRSEFIWGGGDNDMDLGSRELKKLIFSSGGQCSLCKIYCYLFDTGKTVKMKASHISSRNPEFPSKDFDRFDPSFTEEERNKKYENRILTCPDCDLKIDNPANTQYTNERLHQIKDEHEKYIEIKKKTNQSEATQIKEHLKLLTQQFSDLIKNIDWKDRETQKALENNDFERVKYIHETSSTATHTKDVLNDLIFQCSNCGERGVVFIDLSEENVEGSPKCPNCGKEFET